MEASGAARFAAYIQDHWLGPAVSATIPLATTRFEVTVPKMAHVTAAAQHWYLAQTTTDFVLLTKEQKRTWRPADPPKFLMTNTQMVEEITAHRNGGSVTGAEKQSKETLAAALIAERKKPTAIFARLGGSSGHGSRHRLEIAPLETRCIHLRGGG